jgi:outer membrane protein assembly factor BamB
MSIRNALAATFLACVVLAFASAARAEDWPQWRGPNRDGISNETGLLKQWPEGGPKLLWQASDAGGGYSTPAVVGERLYVISSQGEADESVQARNVADGKVAWSVRIGKVGPNTRAMNYPGSRSTPTVVGDALYALGSDGDLACLSTSDGKVRWKKSLRSDFGGKPGQWAYAESPLVDGDTVVCTPGGSDATMVALNKKTGDVIWKSAIPGGDDAAYSSIIAVQAGGGKQYVTFLGKGLVGVDAKTGKFLWRYEQTAQGSPANIPTPVAHDGYVYSATARGGGGLVKISAGPGGATAEQVYFDKKLPTAIGGAVLVGEHLFGTGQVLTCAEFTTGKVKWTDRGVGTASVLSADGALYLHAEQTGEVALVAASPEGYKELGRFTPPGQPDHGKSKAWAYPVVANGRLYVRDQNMLWCYDVKG